MHFDNGGYFGFLPNYMFRATYSVPFDMNSSQRSQHLCIDGGFSLNAIIYITGGYNFILTKNDFSEQKGFRLSFGANI